MPELTRDFLHDWCRRHDGGPYPAYRDLRGRYRLDGLALEILRVQPDPFAGPSRLRLLVPWRRTAVPPELARGEGARGAALPGVIDPRAAAAVAWRDFLARRIRSWLETRSGPSLRIDAGGQQVLDRSAVLFRPDGVEIRLEADLPARGRRILGRDAARLLLEAPESLPRGCLEPEAFDLEAARRHAATVEDFAALQTELERQGWAAFVADGARLPRRAGNDDRPLRTEPVVPFVSPPELRREVRLPHAGPVAGMAVEGGVTLLCGGGFHGKSTLLRALGAAIHPHIPGDGRERVATRPDAMPVRAEDGRAVHAVDLRPFLHDLPFNRPVVRFTTSNASGSTSQAAAILEAIQGGARLLLIDEDTAATNFMIRDGLMERLLAREQEPITPFLERARTLWEELGVSSILVIGGSGEYFRVADRVLLLDSFRPADRTAAAREVVREQRRPPVPNDPSAAEAFRRAVDPAATRLPRGDAGVRIKALGPRRLLVGRAELELDGLESLRGPSQARFLARALGAWMREQARAETGTLALTPAPETLERWFVETWRSARLDAFDAEPRGDLAAIRCHDLLAAVNRLRGPEAASEPGNGPGRPPAGRPGEEGEGA